MKEKIRITKKILLTWHKHADLLDTPDPARALLGPPPERAAGESGRDLVDFLKKVAVFEDLGQGDLRRLARIVHERSYRDGEIIYEQGKPGTALYLVRAGVVEIVRRNGMARRCPFRCWNRPPPLRSWLPWGPTWFAGPRPGLTARSPWWPLDVPTWMPSAASFPLLANKILKKLAQFMAMRIQSFWRLIISTRRGVEP